eukprot:5880293-Prymnesium_polylepis.2
MPFVMLVLLPLIMIFSVAMYGLWPHTIFADRTDFDSKRWASIFSVFENMLVPSIVGELPELTEDGTLRIAAHYYFDWQSYELATENGADYSFSKVLVATRSCSAARPPRRPPMCLSRVQVQEVILTLAMLVLNIVRIAIRTRSIFPCLEGDWGDQWLVFERLYSSIPSCLRSFSSTC